MRRHDVEVLTVGQYLRPTPRHLPVERYWHPDEFAELKERALEMGFAHVESGPLVRSSYHAEEQVAGATRGAGRWQATGELLPIVDREG
jgi:lipoic acid synthetase